LLKKALRRAFRSRVVFYLLIGIYIGVLLVFLGYTGIKYTSGDKFCGICHVHPHVKVSWKKSTHFKNKSGVVIHCVECHLPPGGISYMREKIRLGVRDSFGYFFKDTKKIDWEAKSALDYAITYTYDSSCIKCHEDLYSLELKPKGVKAHEYYMAAMAKLENKKNTRETVDAIKKLRCINCHLDVGHYREIPPEEMLIAGEEEIKQPSYPPDTGEFRNYTEVISGSDISFNMIVIPEGTFTMGSPDNEPCRSDDEGNPRQITISRFWMGEIEVTWREFDFFYKETATRGKTNNENQKPKEVAADTTVVDAITGPTPPYGAPDQGWGKGLRPAITMTHHAAMVYCEWLSKATGKKYRLPTEAEWEYACRAGTAGPYYFEGNPKKLTRRSWINRLFGTKYTVIGHYVWFAGNSTSKTQPPYTNKPNPWGLYNMPGNVSEFCLDWYAAGIPGGGLSSSAVSDPRGPESGTEHVIRGGSYRSDPADLRSAARSHTLHDQWLVTDPQLPKSIWWYSDSKDVGFRVMREYEEK
jgi:formylglycine-generating enzyme required for sulfatase activity